MNHQTTRALLRVAVVWMILSGTFAHGFAQQAPPGIQQTEVSQRASAQRQEAFEIVWKTVNQTFYDPKFGGVDWKAVHDR